MAVSVYANTTHFLVALLVILLVLLMSPTSRGDADTDICSKWSDMARRLSGSGKIQNCSNTQTSECMRLDCSGTTTFSHPLIPDTLSHMIEIDYCFGTQLNSCNDPVSMDFYLQVPDKNFSRQLRISHDDDIPFRDLSFSLAIGSAYPMLHFRFDRRDSNIMISVTASVELHTFGSDIDLDDLKATLIDRALVPIRSCDKTISDTNGSPPKKFMPSQCHPMKYVPFTTAMPISYKPSGTLNQTCGLVDSFCGFGELCDLSRNPPSCQCSSEFTLSPKKDGCVAYSRLNQACQENDECGFNEECLSQPSAPGKFVCQCREHYSYSQARAMCILSGSGDHKGTSNATTPRPDTKSTPEPHSSDSGKKQNGDDSGYIAEHGLHNLPIYIGAGLAGVLAIGLVIWGVSFYLRRRKRLQLTVNDESSNPMLGGDDSDMIM